MPVYVGDTIAFAQEIIELRKVAKRPEVGLRIARHTGTNQRGEVVYSMLNSTFIERRRRGGWDARVGRSRKQSKPRAQLIAKRNPPRAPRRIAASPNPPHAASGG